MDIRRLPAEEDAVRRYLADLRVPFNRELESIVDDFALAEDVDLVSEELEFCFDNLDSESYRAWVAVNGPSEADSLADVDGEFAGFVTTNVDECPSSFDRPDRLVIRDLYVREPYRGTGLATDLIDRARERARESGCGEFELEVDLENDRAMGFYEKLGFEPVRYTMRADVEGR